MTHFSMLVIWANTRHKRQLIAQTERDPKDSESNRIGQHFLKLEIKLLKTIFRSFSLEIGKGTLFFGL